MSNPFDDDDHHHHHNNNSRRAPAAPTAASGTKSRRTTAAAKSPFDDDDDGGGVAGKGRTRASVPPPAQNNPFDERDDQPPQRRPAKAPVPSRPSVGNPFDDDGNEPSSGNAGSRAGAARRPAGGGDDGTARRSSSTTKSPFDDGDPNQTSGRKADVAKRPGSIPTKTPFDDDAPSSSRPKKPDTAKRSAPAKTPFDDDDDEPSRRSNVKKPDAVKRPDSTPTKATHDGSLAKQSAQQKTPFDGDEVGPSRQQRPGATKRPVPTKSPFDDEEEEGRINRANYVKPDIAKQPMPSKTPFDDDETQRGVPAGRPAVPSNPARQSQAGKSPFDDDNDFVNDTQPLRERTPSRRREQNPFDEDKSTSDRALAPESANERASAPPYKKAVATSTTIPSSAQSGRKGNSGTTATTSTPTPSSKRTEAVKTDSTNPFDDPVSDHGRVRSKTTTTVNPFDNDDDGDYNGSSNKNGDVSTGKRDGQKQSLASRVPPTSIDKPCDKSRTFQELMQDPVLKAFETTFDDKEYVKRVTQTLLSLMEHGELTEPDGAPHAFPSEPFLDAFTTHHAELQELSQAVDTELCTVEQAADQANALYQARLAGFYKQCDEISEALAILEDPFSSAGSQIVRIGEQLAVLEKQRSKAEDARVLLQYLLEFNSGMETSDIFLNESRIHEAALVAQRLQAIAADLDSSQTNTARHAIDDYCKRIEGQLLQLFDDASKTGDFATMRKSAQTLHALNGGPIAVNQFIDKHPLMQRARMATSKRLQDKGAYVRGHTMQGLKDMLEETQAVLARDATIINKVFSNAEFVMALFTQKVVAALVPPYIVALLGLTKKGLIRPELMAAERKTMLPVQVNQGFNPIPNSLLEPDEPPMPYLDTLHEAHQATIVAFKNLQQYNFDGLLDMKQLMEQTFGPFLLNGAYIEEESSYLQAVVVSLLIPFQQSKVERKTAAARSRSAFSWGTAVSTQTGKTTSTNMSPTETPSEDLSVETALEILHLHASASKRCVDLSGSAEICDNIVRLFNIVTTSVCQMYIGSAADIVLEQLAGARDNKTEPPLEAFDTVMTIATIVHMLQKHFQENVVNILPPASTAFREVLLVKNRAFAVIEVEINSIIELLLYEIVKKIGRTLSKQNKAEFRPKEVFGTTLQPSSNQPTAVCLEVTAYLHRVYSIAKHALDGLNLEAFLTELGTQFYQLLFDHLRRFTVNSAGGLILARELTEYQYSVRAFNIPSVNQLFDTLRQLGNVFVVRPDNLKLLISEGTLSNLDRELIRSCIALREDYKKEKLHLYFDSSPTTVLSMHSLS